MYSGHIAAIVEKASAIEIGVLHGVNVEVLIDRVAAIVTPADSHGFDRPGSLHPGKLVNLVDVIIAEYAAAGPEEGMEEADLMHQFRNAFGFHRRSTATGAHAVTAHR